ncbi:MAG TPA: M61 family peptidase [Polyangia bacterium]|nr:M61 family peptidase [Polyangia bacterium]
MLLSLLPALLVAPVRAQKAVPAPITLAVDAREAPRRILHAILRIPAQPGPLTLYYPKWIPGDHTPSGPIVNLAGLTIGALGKTLAWQRDPVDMYAIHVQVPPGASSVEIALDYLSQPRGGIGVGEGAEMTAQLARINWNLVLLYPAGRPAADWTYVTRLELPPGWKLGSALPLARESGGRFEFRPVPLPTLIDSPVLAGANLRKIALGGTPPHEIDLAADSAAALEAPSELISGWQKLVAEAGALFGARHYQRYHFLLALSDHIATGGLEHHESSDNRAVERALVDDKLRKDRVAGLLPHEFVHSWNGKYRRPAGLVTPDYQTPMRDELLWVYEGLTNYLGWVLTGRSGLRPADLHREELATVAADMEHVAGRRWRPLADTTASAPFLYNAPHEWASWRRGVDFYPEGVLIWLEADAIIRKQTQGRRSLDDFCKKFHGGASGPPAVKPYTLDDVLAALGEVAPYDWRSFVAARVSTAGTRAPLFGLEAAGWHLVYSDTENEYTKLGDRGRRGVSLTYSIGATVHEDGSVIDVVPGLPAAKAGLAPGMRLVAVDGRRFSGDVMRAALRARRPLDLLVENGEFFRTYRVDYRGGERYPHLSRDSSRPDLLSEILKPRAAGAKP